MRVLLLEHPNFTHLTWYIWEGLNRLLGWQNVVEFPRKNIFHGEDHRLDDTKWYRDVYREIAEGKPLPQGCPALVPGESLTTNDERFFRCTGLYTELSRSPQREFTEEEIVDTIESFDLIILGNSNRVPTVALGRLRDRCKRLPPIVYLDAGERDELNAHWWHVFRPALVFKQALTPSEFAKYPSVQVPCKLYPLPMCNPFVTMGGPETLRTVGASVGDRPIDILCTHGMSWPERADLQVRVSEIAKKHDFMSVTRNVALHPNGPSAGMPYFAVVGSSRFAISMRGSTRDAERYWQLPAFGPCLVADGTMGCVHPFPFEDGKTAVFYRSLDELERQLVAMHNDEPKRIAIAQAGREHLRRFHSAEARTMFLLGIVRQRLGLAYTPEQDAQLRCTREALGWSSELPEWQTGPVVGYGLPDWHGRLDYEN